MFKKIIKFLRKIGLLHGGSSKWKGKGTGDYNIADLDKRDKDKEESSHSDDYHK
jgi:hypothetical protein